jgi:hypothetical protein
MADTIRQRSLATLEDRGLVGQGLPKARPSYDRRMVSDPTGACFDGDTMLTALAAQTTRLR